MWTGLVFFVGCAGWPTSFLPQPVCQHQLVVTDVATGAIALELDTDCVESGEFPNSAAWELLLSDEVYEPITDPDSVAVCNSAALDALRLDGLPPDGLAVSLTEATAADSKTDQRDELVDGAWITARYYEQTRGGGSSQQRWAATFRLGVEDSVLYEDDLGERCPDR